uniref:NOMO-like N-terminal beta-sandwich domain-containing protein n=1 Tax=Meloidogyne enterolobii TaxID=390850 RepID=A0A6V7XD04_MELEN|nr:unnamed protein product [Meloidogyne enterolobii]
MFYLLKLYLFLFLIFLQQCSANVIECEGFVKSAVQINLSDIKVKLFTSQGNLKYEAECNPQNGYFLRGHFSTWVQALNYKCYII